MIKVELEYIVDIFDGEKINVNTIKIILAKSSEEAKEKYINEYLIKELNVNPKIAQKIKLYAEVIDTQYNNLQQIKKLCVGNSNKLKYPNIDFYDKRE